MKYTLALALAIVLTALGQVLLKRGAGEGRTVARSLVAAPTLVGYASLGIVTLLMPYAMLRHDLASVTAYSSVAQLLVLALSHFWLGEGVGRGKVVGVLLIVAGVGAYSL